MPKKRNKVNPEDSRNVAERGYEPDNYLGNTQFDKGMAETHEQVSDDYKEGTIDRKLEDK
ncbi:YozQ family protein [Lentibacillus jeotgali]|uniref:YozQ family protein n=1 Tax=Lentibacillus jeotgali TaxID=558169 RepID=UPI000262604A|nr:YozQ family protein [Lentibacillus jeotgali]